VRRRGPALEVLFSAFALNGTWKMTPTRARSSELGTTVRCGNVIIQREGRQISAHKRGPVGERMPDAIERSAWRERRTGATRAQRRTGGVWRKAEIHSCRARLRNGRCRRGGIQPRHAA
jgi:hypothetical protein